MCCGNCLLSESPLEVSKSTASFIVQEVSSFIPEQSSLVLNQIPIPRHEILALYPAEPGICGISQIENAPLSLSRVLKNIIQDLPLSSGAKPILYPVLWFVFF